MDTYIKLFSFFFKIRFSFHFFLTPTPYYTQWLEEIENRYFDEPDDLVRQSFQAALSDVQEPYSFILHVIYKAFFDLFSKRIPITYYALDEFDIWLDLKKKNGEYVPQPEDNRRHQAMDIICRSDIIILIN